MNPRACYSEFTKPTSTGVLRLDPQSSSTDGTLSGKLIEIDVDEPPEYEAISYVWGKRKDAGQVLCEGPNNQKSMIKCTGNGEDVLRRMQHQTKSRLLWLDAI
ncbi:hypothetical protein BCR34DRAFT_290624 [Clohesyomyces aquaticus]|uniref:Heterokaryon incompatibility domain-containing protein n=1 Tax=Clohesyomyces aquaticus TaxID=1231657 RepID=A0A1Y1ZS45_9PLEO|nr:hypothetical protein BCR34DRAFT_290624 [Clohesyomyces aquaticus]